MRNPTALVSKLWNTCNTAAVGRDDGLSRGDDVEQLTFPLFPKTAGICVQFNVRPTKLPSIPTP